MSSVPELALTDPAVVLDPFTAYGTAREQGPLAKLVGPGFPPMWVLTRHAEARAMLTDPRFALSEGSYHHRPEIPEHCRPYLRTMQEMEGEEHARLRRLATPAFAARRALEFRPQIEKIVGQYLDALPAEGPVDLLTEFAQPLPMAVICELVGVPEAERPRWHEYGAAVVQAHGEGFAAAVPGIIDSSRSLMTHPDSALLEHLTSAGLTDTETVALVWQLVLAGQTPANFIANSVETLLSHPDQLEILRAEPELWPGAVEELMRWCGSQLLTIPRQATEDVELHGSLIRRGEQVTASIASANRDPRVFADPDRFDVRRTEGAHLGFAHGSHFCLGASFARVQVEVALTALFDRFPGLRVLEANRMPDPGTWHLAGLPVAW